LLESVPLNIYIKKVGSVCTLNSATVRRKFGYGTGNSRVRYGENSGAVPVKVEYGTGDSRVRYGENSGTVPVEFGYGTEKNSGTVRVMDPGISSCFVK